MAHSAHDIGDHDGCDPDTCFTAKMRYWRSGGGAPFKFTHGKESFHGPTIGERQREIIEGAAAEGRSVRLKTHYDKKGSVGYI